MVDNDSRKIRDALTILSNKHGSDSPEFIQFLENLKNKNLLPETTHTPVDIKTFIKDPYFLGKILKTVWDGTIKSVTEVIEGEYAEAVFTGAIGVAKTTRATIVAAYNLYCLSCYINPQEKIGLMPNSEIVIVMLNKNETLAREVTYKKFRGLIKRIPYFQENFMFSNRIESKMVFPKDITVIYAAATNDKLLGMDIVSGCFPPEQTAIASDGKLITMGESVNKSNSFLTVDESSFARRSDETKIINTGVKSLIRLKFDNGESIVCTPDQKFKGKESEWVRAGEAKGITFKFTDVKDLQEGLGSGLHTFQPTILYARCIEIQVVSIIPQRVYDIENTGNTHIFFAPSKKGGVALLAKNCIDEMNFFDRTEKSKRSKDGGLYDQAQEIYNGLIRRIKSRFMGVQNLTGCISIVSSRSHKGDFTDQRIKALEEDKHKHGYSKTYVSNLSQWEIIPHTRTDGTVRFSGDYFLVAIGNSRLKSEIIKDENEAGGREVIQVPVEYEIDFGKDIEGSLRDFAGRVSSSTGKYFTDLNAINYCFDRFETEFQNNRIFIEEEWDLTNGYPTINPRYTVHNQNSFRAVHIDLGLTHDRCGIAIGHSVTDIANVTRRRGDGYVPDHAPIITYDDFIGFNPPENGEIQISDVRKVILWLHKEIGIPIKWITMDGYHSRDFLQIMKRKGYETKTISVEGENAYLLLKNAINEERVIMPKHDLLYEELTNLQQDEKTRRVDHNANFGKDVADGMAGVSTMILEQYEKGTLYQRANIIKGMYQGESKTSNLSKMEHLLGGKHIVGVAKH